MTKLTPADPEKQNYGKEIFRRKLPKFFIHYQSTLAAISVALFFTFFDIYFWESFKIVPPVVFINLLNLAVIILLFLARASKISYRIPRELIIWCVAYLTISLFGFLVILSLPNNPGEAGFQALRTRILSVIFLVVMFLIFSKHPKVQTLTRVAICFAVILAIVNNILEFADPSIFGLLNNTGRAAGWYINPNIAGCALMLGMIFGIGVLPRIWRIPFAILVIVGVFMTFSRGAILGWFIVMAVFAKWNTIPRRQLFIWAASIIGISVLFGSILNGIFDLDELQRSGIVTANFDNIRERLEWFQNPKGEESADSRVEVVLIAWKMFGDRPLLGNGLASTENLNGWGISTHNMYLQSLADHGLIGAIILPTLVYATVYKARGETREVAWAFGIFISIWGFFSHNILEERYILMSFALMAAMSRSSRTFYKRKVFKCKM